MDVFEVEFLALQEWTPFIEKLPCQREEENKQNDYVVYVAIVKRSAGCTENQGSWPRVNQQHVYLNLQRSGNIECATTGANCYSSNSPQDGLEVPCTLCFSW